MTHFRFKNLGNIALVFAILFMMLTIPYSSNVFAVTISPSSTPTLKIKQSTTPGTSSNDSILMAVELVATCQANCPTTQTGEWASDWSYVTCLAMDRPEGGYNYFMKFESTGPDWPSSWPSTVTCSKAVNSDLYTVTADIKDAFSNTWNTPVPETGWNPSSGLAFNFQSADNVVQIAGARYLIAPANNYADSCPLAVKSGSAWTGVRCCVNDRTDIGEDDIIAVGVGEVAEAGTGTCSIPLVGGGNTSFTVSVTRP